MRNAAHINQTIRRVWADDQTRRAAALRPRISPTRRRAVRIRLVFLNRVPNQCSSCRAGSGAYGRAANMASRRPANDRACRRSVSRTGASGRIAGIQCEGCEQSGKASEQE